MVKSSTQKSKTKVSSKKAAASSKKAPKQTLKAVAVSNGRSDSEEPQNTGAELGLNGEEHNVDEAQSETLVQKVDRPVNSRRKKAAPDAANVESTEIGSDAKKLKSGPLSKTKGKPIKENKMDEQQEETSTSRKRKTEVPKTENIETKRSRGRKNINEPMPTTNTKRQKGKENKMEAENEAETAPESETNVEPVLKSSRSRTRTAAMDDDAEDITEPTSQEEAEPEPVPQSSTSRKRKAETETENIETKRSRVLLNVPPPKSISGKVFVIGENDVGQLGFNSEDVEVKKRPTMLELPHSIVDVAAGGMHSVCLTEGGEVITFGCNDEGALGRLTSEDDGSECIPRGVEIPEKIIQISAGDSHSAALTESGQVYLWGNFRSGDGPMGLTADGVKQKKPIKILNGVNVVKIASGTEHLACLTNEGAVYTCGCGENGQLGRVSERLSRGGGRKGLSTLLEPAAVPIAKSRSRAILIDDIWAGSYTTFLRAQGTGLIYAFGLNNWNHLGFENERVRFQPKQVQSFNDKKWLEITGGQHHTLALDGDGLVHAIGRKEYGRLGLGEGCEETSVPTVITTLEKEKCRNISCGNCVSFSVTDEGSVFSWGMGTNHQLGHGNDDDSHVPRLVEGDFLNSWKAFKISGGGQHTLLLASPKENAKSDKK